MKTLLLWLRIIRPQTLPASLCPVLVAALLLLRAGLQVNPGVVALVALCALALQILSNLINDYYDFRRGTDRSGRAGFRRALAEGEVSERAMLRACIVVAVVACLLGVPLIIVGGWPIILIGLSALLFAWLYTATSHSLSYLGIADIFALLYYGVIAAAGTAWIVISYAAKADYGDMSPGGFLSPGAGVLDSGQLFNTCPVSGFCSTGYSGITARSVLLQACSAGAVSGLISMCVLMINNLRDRDCDRLAGKRTLVVRFGRRAGETIMLLEVLLMPLLAWFGFHAVVPMLILIPALFLWLKVRRAEGPEYNRCLIMAGMTNVVYLLLVVITYLL